MAFFEDFKKFAFKGNVVDLAVGVVIGGAFGKIVTAVVSDLVMPLVSLVLPSGDWRTNGIVLRTAADPKDNVVLKYGDFVGAVLDFFVVALALYFIVSKLIKAAEGKWVHHHDPAAAPPAIKECPYCLETIPAKARRCKACTAEQPAAATT
ncbi:MAG TPA: large conductance mechanosensitive channel protein MscL [Polyangiaceae bacterium]|jgi:large conductance mechanosensitive channel|nr:large conductance mechanosensitive channel protein MscL [Polyangiaceae bacterium]